jgi:hypothetical protein
VGKQQGVQVKEPEERISILRRDAILLSDLGAAQNLRHLVDLSLGQEE